MSNQKRDFFRLEYPLNDRPLIIVNGTAYELVDISEKGVKFLVPKTFRPARGETIKGTIRFRTRKEVHVVGNVIRIIEDAQCACVLVLTEGVPLPIMMEEQRVLIKKYKK